MRYQANRLTIRRYPNDKFTLVGDVSPNSDGSDHFQLLYEALEIAAHSDDKYAADFAAMRDELLEASKDWVS